MSEKSNNPRVLVAPLDWGLGHTTRCIPIIRELLLAGAEVILAGNEVQKKILLNEFPGCRFLFLPGYTIAYSKNSSFFAFKIFAQLPKILKAVREEKRWLAQVIDQYQIDAVISDNRYGLQNKRIPSVFITHQLQIKAGYFLEPVLKWANYRFIQKFSQCWIPDFETGFTLAGRLSHPARLPQVACKYIGPLSRMKTCAQAPTKDRLLVVLSGPEPQRSIFETLVLKQLPEHEGVVTLVRGLPNSQQALQLPGVKVYNHLVSKDLQQEICEADVIVCRCGYSSVMDIFNAGASSIMVPTPAQTEQEYLAKHLMKEGFALSCAQKVFSLKNMLARAGHFPYRKFAKKADGLLRQVVGEFVAELAITRP